MECGLGAGLRTAIQSGYKAKSSRSGRGKKKFPEDLVVQKVFQSNNPVTFPIPTLPRASLEVLDEAQATLLTWEMLGIDFQAPRGEVLDRLAVAEMEED
ncbi:hypothetical protein V6N13_046352 [Hibiscus sabdariffa]|uniref:Uncharacterized protein n=1 Tax=Hibiscus sabdariffa TaxID=183260 RepID=A0ABR2D9X5_9ROSI